MVTSNPIPSTLSLKLNEKSFAASALTSGTVNIARLPIIPNSQLANQGITINGSLVQLGQSTTIADNSIVMAIALG